LEDTKMGLIRRIVHGFAKGMSTVAAIILLGMMLVTCGDVAGRYFGYPIPGTYDLVGLGGGAVLALGIAMSHISGMKINVDCIYKRPEFLRRVVSGLVYILSVGTLGLISWRCFKLGCDLWRRGRVSDTIQIPLYPFLYLAGLGMAFYGLAILLEALMPSVEEPPRH
jgi:TRAP-type C4-dicarboxylate transport system permease small subunit